MTPAPARPQAPPPLARPEIVRILPHLITGVPYHGANPRSCIDRPTDFEGWVQHGYAGLIFVRVETSNVPDMADVFVWGRVADRYVRHEDGTERCDPFSLSEPTLLYEGPPRYLKHGVSFSGEEWPCRIEVTVEVRASTRVLARRTEQFALGGDGCW